MTLDNDCTILDQNTKKTNDLSEKKYRYSIK